MRFHRNLVTPAKPLSFDEDLDFSSFDFSKQYPLLGLSEVHASGEFFLEEDGLSVSIALSGSMWLSDAYTLEKFEQKFDFEDEFALLSSPDEEGEGYIFAENTIELLEVAFCAIHSRVPMSPKKKGSKLSKEGDGYAVYLDGQTPPEPTSSPFDALKDYDVEDPK